MLDQHVRTQWVSHSQRFTAKVKKYWLAPAMGLRLHSWNFDILGGETFATTLSIGEERKKGLDLVSIQF